MAASKTAAKKTSPAAKTSSASTARKGSAADEIGNKHSVDNPGATSGPHPVVEAPTGKTEEVMRAQAERRAENIPAPAVEAELTHGVDPITGEELDVEEAHANNQTVMVPESKGTSADLIMPSHVQAPSVEQVVGGLTKANSSTSQRVRAAQREAATK